MTIPSQSHSPKQYRIRLKGHLDNRWSDWFEGMSVSSRGAESVLSGPVADQAALHGLLNRIRDLNLTLLSLESLYPDNENQHRTETSL